MLVIGGSHTGSNRLAGTGTALGTCGELVQGFTSQGQPFHVTCPVEKSSTVSVTLSRAPEFRVMQLPPNLNKIELGITRAAEYLDIEPCEVRVAHWTDLEVGKGMGSSTADIVAGARALANAAGRKLNAAELASIATSIESSDGSMYPGFVAFNQKNGAVLARYKWWPQFIVVMIVPSKNLNTESVDFAGKKVLGKEFDEILASLETAAEKQDTSAFAEAATRSAQLNSRFVPNPYQALLADRVKDFGAAGLNVGHTGTLVGLLFDIEDEKAALSAAAAAVEVQGMFPDAKVETTVTPPFLDA